MFVCGWVGWRSSPICKENLEAKSEIIDFEVPTTLNKYLKYISSTRPKIQDLALLDFLDNFQQLSFFFSTTMVWDCKSFIEDSVI